MIRLGTRASVLARWQAAQVDAALRQAGHTTEIVEVGSLGDDQPDVPLTELGSVAIFTHQLDLALLEERIDMAVHSLKDLPTRLEAGIVLGAVGPREDPSDAFVGKDCTWDTMPEGATVATSSVRRKAQLLRARPDIRVVPIRGNVDTRLAKLDRSDDWAGTVLASAGLLRLNLAERITNRLDPEVMLPAPGQGAIAVTVRRNDLDQITAAAAFGHRPSAVCGTAERSLLRDLDGGCQVPVAALAETTPEEDGFRMRLRARVLSLDGRSAIDDKAEGLVRSLDDAEALGQSLAQGLEEAGAEQLLREARAQTGGHH